MDFWQLAQGQNDNEWQRADKREMNGGTGLFVCPRFSPDKLSFRALIHPTTQRQHIEQTESTLVSIMTSPLTLLFIQKQNEQNAQNNNQEESRQGQ